MNRLSISSHANAAASGKEFASLTAEILQIFESLTGEEDVTVLQGVGFSAHDLMPVPSHTDLPREQYTVEIPTQS